MDSKLLSVCLITFNHKDYIVEAIESILMQKVNFSWELIIADDYSTDGTREIILDYKNKYPDFIKLIFQEKNVGAAKNFMDLMTSPTSKYISYIEGDDYWTDNLKLQKQIEFLENNPEYTICMHNVIVDDYISNSKYEWPGKETKETKTIEDLFISGSGGATSSIVYINRVFGDFPDFFPSLAAGDGPLQMLCCSKGKMKYFYEPMGVYRKGRPGNSVEVFKEKSIKNKKEHIGIEFFHMLNIINTFDKYFNYKYSKYIDNGRFYCYYNISRLFNNENKSLKAIYFSIVSLIFEFLKRKTLTVPDQRIQHLKEIIYKNSIAKFKIKVYNFLKA